VCQKDTQEIFVHFSKNRLLREKIMTSFLCKGCHSNTGTGSTIGAQVLCVAKGEPELVEPIKRTATRIVREQCPRRVPQLKRLSPEESAAMGIYLKQLARITRIAREIYQKRFPGAYSWNRHIPRIERFFQKYSEKVAFDAIISFLEERYRITAPL
jgi:hypothetical protein